jgi:hypothetical protein
MLSCAGLDPQRNATTLNRIKKRLRPKKSMIEIDPSFILMKKLILSLFCITFGFFSFISFANDEGKQPDQQTDFIPPAVEQQIYKAYIKKQRTFRPGYKPTLPEATEPSPAAAPENNTPWYSNFYHQLTNFLNPWYEYTATPSLITGEEPTNSRYVFPPADTDGFGQTQEPVTQPSPNPSDEETEFQLQHPLGYTPGHRLYFPPADTDGFGQQFTWGQRLAFAILWLAQQPQGIFILEKFLRR